jgi:uncharacterized small protein (DUF1192 family)
MDKLKQKRLKLAVQIASLDQRIAELKDEIKQIKRRKK